MAETCQAGKTTMCRGACFDDREIIGVAFDGGWALETALAEAAM
jgi:hypothetical protein